MGPAFFIEPGLPNTGLYVPRPNPGLMSLGIGLGMAVVATIAVVLASGAGAAAPGKALRAAPSPEDQADSDSVEGTATLRLVVSPDHYGPLGNVLGWVSLADATGVPLAGREVWVYTLERFGAGEQRLGCPFTTGADGSVPFDSVRWFSKLPGAWAVEARFSDGPHEITVERPFYVQW